MKITAAVLTISMSILAVVLMIVKQFNWAVFCMTVMFTLTNAFRARDMVEKGYEREARFMRNLSIFFGVASVAVLCVNLFM